MLGNAQRDKKNSSKGKLLIENKKLAFRQKKFLAASCFDLCRRKKFSFL